MEHEFSQWISVTHFFNFLFITLLIRSGVQILSAHPRLYWNDDCTPGSEWIRFTKKKAPFSQGYTSTDDRVSPSPLIALPGRQYGLGMGRYWHFLCALLWMLNGFIYVAFLFCTDSWRRLIPTSWDIFSQSWDTILTFATFHLPQMSHFHPYDPLQQLAYAFTIFICAPLTILTGIAMSPAVAASCPWYIKLFGGRQSARSIHFLLMVYYLGFLIIHVTLVVLTGFAKNMVHIVFGTLEGNETLVVWLALSGIALVIVIHIASTIWAQKRPRQVQNSIGVYLQKLTRFFFYRMKSSQYYTKADITPHFWVNGSPPKTEEWLDLLNDNFSSYHLEIKGLVKNSSSFSLDDLKKLPKTTQITKHICIQGWSGVAEWTGVSLHEIMKRVQPTSDARYIVFHSYQMNKPVGGESGLEIEYYDCLDLKEALYPQTILAYEMNGTPLPEQHGAPLRLRMETKLGYRMVKWIKSIEFVDDYKKIGLGHGGFREDQEYYDHSSQI